IAYSFTKSRNSILLAKYVTGFCTSRSTGRRGAETVRAAFRSRAAPPPGRTPPPLAHPPPFPAPGSTLDPSASFSHPPSARAQHPSPGLRLALFAHPSRLRRLLPGLHRPSFRAPPLRVRTPCVQSSPDAWPLRARTPCVPPSVWPSHCTHTRPSCASGMRARGVGGVRAWWGTGEGRSPGGGDCPRTRGGRHRPLCLPGMCAKGEAGGRGEARRKLGGGDGEAQAEGRTEGGGAHCPSCPSPRIRTKGGGARARGGWRVSRGRGNSPGGGAFSRTEREGGRSVRPAPSVRAKGVEDVQAGWGATQAEGTAARERKGGGWH